MKDRTPKYPGRVKLTPVSGQTNVYDMTRADSPTQDGDPINKATLLKDTTAALYDLGTDALPDDVLQVIRTVLDERAIVESGTYTGTGTKTPSLVFSIVPKFVVIQEQDSSVGGNYEHTGWWISEMTYLITYSSQSTPRPVTLNGKTFSWTGSATDNAKEVLNESGKVYSYIGIGVIK